MFLAKVVADHADEKYMDEKGKFSLEKADPLVYSHGTYYSVGKPLGTFGYSVAKKKTAKKKTEKKSGKKPSKATGPKCR